MPLSRLQQGKVIQPIRLNKNNILRKQDLLKDITINPKLLEKYEQDVKYCLIFKYRGKLHFIPVSPKSKSTSLVKKRPAVLKQYKDKESAAIRFYKQQCNLWDYSILPCPMLEHTSIKEGIYLLLSNGVYYVDYPKELYYNVRSLKEFLRHDAEVTQIEKAQPQRVFQQINKIADSIQLDEQNLNVREIIEKDEMTHSDVFSDFVTSNINNLYDSFKDYMDVYDVDITKERIGAMFSYNVNNFTLSTRFSDEGLGISRQFTNMLGFGENETIPARSMLDDGEGFGFIFNANTGEGRLDQFGSQGQYMDNSGGLVGPVDANGDPLPENNSGGGFIIGSDYQYEDQDGNVVGYSWVMTYNDGTTRTEYHFTQEWMYKNDPANDPTVGNDGKQPDQPEPEEPKEPDTPTEPEEPEEPEQPEPEEPEEPEEPDDDDGPETGGEVGITPRDGGMGGGSSGSDGDNGRLPFGNIGGLSGGGRGGGYTCPDDGYTGNGSGIFGHFRGIVSPIGGDGLGPLIIPTRDSHHGSAPTRGELLKKKLDALTQPRLDAPTLSFNKSVVKEAKHEKWIPSTTIAAYQYRNVNLEEEINQVFSVQDLDIARRHSLTHFEQMIGPTSSGFSSAGVFGFAGETNWPNT